MPESHAAPQFTDEQIPPQVVSCWIYTNTTLLCACPKCQAQPGDYCRTPGGRKVQGGVPHVERCIELNQKYPHVKNAGRMGSPESEFVKARAAAQKL